MAIGPSANAGSAGLGTAIGAGASAVGQRSVALGAGSIATDNFTVVVGNTSQLRRIVNVAAGTGDIDASTLAQQGPVDVVTIDVNGTLGRQSVASAASVQNVRTAVTTMQAITDAQVNSLTSSVSALDSRITGLAFQLEDLDQRSRGGIAAAMAMGGTMIVPNSNLSVSANVSTYQGEQGFSGSIAARVTERVYISASVAGSTAEQSTGGRVGVAFGF